MGTTLASRGSATVSLIDALPENLWGYKKRLSFVHHHASRIGAATILDIGCGNGSQLAIPLAEMGYSITGIDPHQKSIERARQSGVGKFINGFSTELPTQSFDVVIISEVLEHLRAPEELLADSLRFISRNGILIVTVPNGYGEFEFDSRMYRGLRLDAAFSWLSRVRRSISKKGEPSTEVASSDDTSGHIQRFTLPRLKRMFAAHGLVLEDRRATSIWSGPLICHTLGRSKRFRHLNAKVADHLPMVFSGGWMFCLRKVCNSV